MSEKGTQEKDVPKWLNLLHFYFFFLVNFWSFRLYYFYTTNLYAIYYAKNETKCEHGECGTGG